MNFDHSVDLNYIYIHWPFCPYKCYFCPFVALAGQDEFMEQYHRALIKEIESFAFKSNLGVPIKTVFFGGGTPSTYPSHLLLDTFGKLNNIYKFDIENEISIEINPGTINLEKLKLFKDLGINRLSIGVQSLNDEVLKKLNRHQKASDVQNVLSDASSLFDNISIDLIVGLPQITADEWKSFIDQIVQWPIKHISMYFLTVHEDTPLYFGVKKQKYILPPDDTVIDLYYWTKEKFETFGFYQYETSNFAKLGYESKHNQAYWKREPYKGFGLGACSFDGKSRFQNEKNLLKYINGVENGENINIFYENLNEEQIWLEKLMLGLRQIKGVFLKDIVDSLNKKQEEKFFQVAKDLCDSNLLLIKDEKLLLTPLGLSVVNEVIVKLSCL